MRKAGKIEVNGRFLLHEMAWQVEVYESQNPEYSHEVGLDFAEVCFQKDMAGEPYALLLAHLRGQSFRRLRDDLLTVPGLRLWLSFPVLGVIYDSDRDIDRWLTSKARSLEVTDLTVGTRLASHDAQLLAQADQSITSD